MSLSIVVVGKVDDDGDGEFEWEVAVALSTLTVRTLFIPILDPDSGAPIDEDGAANIALSIAEAQGWD